MTEGIFYAECTEDCFRIESTDKYEVTEITRNHYRNKHGKEISQEQSEEMVRTYENMRNNAA